MSAKHKSPAVIPLDEAVKKMKELAKTPIVSSAEELLSKVMRCEGAPLENYFHVIVNAQEYRVILSKLPTTPGPPRAYHEDMYLLSISQVVHDKKGRPIASLVPRKDEDLACIVSAVSSRAPTISKMVTPLGRSAQYLWKGEL